jgi:hypothetical protein
MADNLSYSISISVSLDHLKDDLIGLESTSKCSCSTVGFYLFFALSNIALKTLSTGPIVYLQLAYISQRTYDPSFDRASYGLYSSILDQASMFYPWDSPVFSMSFELVWPNLDFDLVKNSHHFLLRCDYLLPGFLASNCS